MHHASTTRGAEPFEDAERARRVDVPRSAGLLDRQRHRAHGGHMENHGPAIGVCLGVGSSRRRERVSQRITVEDRAVHEGDAVGLELQQLGDVGSRRVRQIVHHAHMGPKRDQGVDEMATDEPGPARDDNATVLVGGADADDEFRRKAEHGRILTARTGGPTAPRHAPNIARRAGFAPSTGPLTHTRPTFRYAWAWARPTPIFRC